MINLMYHCIYVNDTKESGFQNVSAMQYKVQADKFEDQVASISTYCGKKNISHNCIKFTFDDGGISFYSVVAPILEKYDFRGVFFISTKFIGAKGFLTEENIRELFNRGHIIGSHSHSHPSNISSLNNEEILSEWRISKQILTRITNSSIISASIPNGYSTKLVDSLACLAGYQKLYTSVPTTKIFHLKDMDILGRYVINKDMSPEDVMAIILSSYRRKKMWVLWYLLKVIKNILGSRYNTLKLLILPRN